MKLKLFFIAFLTSLSCTFANPISTLETHQSNLIYSNLDLALTYERVFIDGFWWIIVYEDGVKIMQYIDPDQ